MKAFSLSTVLQYRKQLEDEAALKLAQARQEMQIAWDNLKIAENEYDHLLSELHRYQNQGIGIEELIRYENRLNLLRRKISELADIYTKKIDIVEKNKLNVIEKSKNRKVLERLKKKQDTKWKNYQQKKENNQLDEIAVLSYQRKHLNNL